ncbi:MAG: hypothetical protein RH917_10590 [Lacipirellulaceae bacterium]
MCDFRIEFTGPAERFPCLARVFSRLQEVKTDNPALEDGQRHELVDNPAWLDLLDETAVELLTSEISWPLEDILDCLLAGEYELVSLSYTEGAGKLVYDPWSFPFGGTDPLKGMLESFGFEVQIDSFYDLRSVSHSSCKKPQSLIARIRHIFRK